MLDRVIKVDEIVKGLAVANNMSYEEYASVLRKALINLNEDDQISPSTAAYKALFSSIKLINRCKLLLGLISNINNNTLNWNILSKFILSDLDEYEYNATLPESITKKSQLMNLLNDIEMASIGKAPYIKYTCADCGKEIFLTVGEVEFYKNTKNKKGQPYRLPKVCKECKENRKNIQKIIKKAHDAGPDKLDPKVIEDLIATGKNYRPSFSNRNIPNAPNNDNTIKSFSCAEAIMRESTIRNYENSLKAKSITQKNQRSITMDEIKSANDSAVLSTTRDVIKSLNDAKHKKIEKNINVHENVQGKKHVSRKTKLHNGEEIPTMEGNNAILDAMRRAGLK